MPSGDYVIGPKQEPQLAPWSPERPPKEEVDEKPEEVVTSAECFLADMSLYIYSAYRGYSNEVSYPGGFASEVFAGCCATSPAIQSCSSRREKEAPLACSAE